MAEPYMPFYWGDYHRDTRHLNTIEHGAYCLLLGHYWCTGKALPDDDAILSRVAGLRPSSWRKIRPTISAFFQIEGGKWLQKRMEKEIKKRREKIRSGEKSFAQRVSNQHQQSNSLPNEQGAEFSPRLDLYQEDLDQDQNLRAGRDAPRAPRRTKLSDSEWMESLKASPAYQGIDIEREAAKASTWLEAKHPARKFTRPFFVNWLNRIDKPLAVPDGASAGKPSKWTGLAGKDYTRGLDEHGRIKPQGT